MTLLYEAFLRKTHSENIQEWFQELKDLLAELEEVGDPSPEDIQLAFHLTQMVENFELMDGNLVERRREKNSVINNLYDRDRSNGSLVFFK
jgi:hypothetical protein